MYQVKEIFKKQVCKISESECIFFTLLTYTSYYKEYLDIRKYYLDFDGETWLPTKDGFRIEASMSNIEHMFDFFVDTVSREEVLEKLRNAGIDT